MARTAAQIGRDWRAKNGVKAVAHAVFHKAVRRGVIAPQPCIICGKAKAEGHHENYSRPLEVIWLCKSHHMMRHGKRADLPLEDFLARLTPTNAAA